MNLRSLNTSISPGLKKASASGKMIEPPGVSQFAINVKDLRVQTKPEVDKDSESENNSCTGSQVSFTRSQMSAGKISIVSPGVSYADCSSP